MMTLEQAAVAMLPMVNEDELRKELQDQVDVAGSQTAWAQAHGLTPQYVNDILRGKRMIGSEFARLLSHERLVVYIRMKPLDVDDEVAT
ncbi:MAG TPA: hypothetical protein VIL30_05920 [Ramlibacter sp.]|jgi:hypothetical protein